MTEENVPDTHKLLEQKEYRNFTSKNFRGIYCKY